MVSIFKSEIISLVLLYTVDVIFRLSFSVMIINLFHAVNQGNTKIAYIYSGILILCLYISNLTRQRACLHS